MGNIMQDSDEQFELFTIEELHEALKHLKPGKAAGLDGITTEVIQHFGTRARSWVLALFNNCATTFCIPKIWRRARVVALLKPGKDTKIRKSYRPISLLCILYKLYERMIMVRMSNNCLRTKLDSALDGHAAVSCSTSLITSRMVMRRDK
ncbi:hypothetical protein Pcinc_030585 [Petrolisthes cinctipes]|uniref:Reverse transcriptase n=1 Tax=Petrolisthes cinctipes TaxID=88211 RepID=A0AAE1EYH8_PETCI|nr:hypothetical protein Pcinc_030585 [Petrolisthes cinctipes]